MHGNCSSLQRRFARRLSSFTLVELLTVITIIALLTALTLVAGGAVLKRAAKARTTSEINAMSAALEQYKTDVGVFPNFVMTGPPNGSYSYSDTGAGGGYQQSSQVLFRSLSGKTNFNDAPISGVTVYYPFKPSQVGNPANNSYVKDAFGISYGYSTGEGTNNSPDVPYNGVGFFDLWSTGGEPGASPSETNSWISNWPH